LNELSLILTLSEFLLERYAGWTGLKLFLELILQLVSYQFVFSDLFHQTCPHALLLTLVFLQTFQKLVDLGLECQFWIFSLLLFLLKLLL